MSDLTNAQNRMREAQQALESARTNGSDTTSPLDWWSNQSAMTMCTVILIFSLLVLYMASNLIKSGKRPAAVLQIYGTILVITMAAFLVVAGYDDQQVSAPLGLLGTIVGYLLGRGTSEKPTGAAAAENAEAAAFGGTVQQSPPEGDEGR